jgi:hypothetical protein
MHVDGYTSDAGSASDISAKSHARLISFRLDKKGTKLGVASVAFPSGIVIGEIVIHRHGDRCWAQPPSRPVMMPGDQDLARDDDGKVRWDTHLIAFTTTNSRRRWSDQVLAAIRAAHPGLLPDDAPLFAEHAP